MSELIKLLKSNNLSNTKVLKIAKKALKFVVIFIGIVFLAALLVLIMDWQQTSYLKLSSNENSETNSYLLKNVNVLPMSQDTILTNKMVYIKNGKIASIADNLTLENIQIIDGQNGFLMPGLVDMHVHVWDKQELGLYLAHGITTIRNVWGMPMHLRIKNEIHKEKIFAPMFFTTSPKLTGPDYKGGDNLQLHSKEEAIAKVKKYKSRGYDFIKTYNGLPKDIFDGILQQASISEMDVIAHPSKNVPYSYHFNPKITTIEHAEDIVQQPLDYQLDTLKLNQVVEEFSNAVHTSICPTLIVYYNIYNMLIDDEILNSQEVEFMNPLIKMFDSKNQFKRWQTTKSNNPSVQKAILDQHEFHLLAIKKLYEAGVNIVCGTDAGIGVTVPGLSIHQELQFYSKAGLSNYEVLKTATINPSKTHSVMANIGSIEKNKTANLILLKNNPLENLDALKNPEMVFIKGRKLNKETLNKFESKAKNRNNLIASIWRYVENIIVEK